MQMLFERSYEYGVHEGLGLLSGSVVAMQGKIPANLMIPHIGWNALNIKKEHPIGVLFVVLRVE
jgi:glutamine amidotransferase